MHELEESKQRLQACEGSVDASAALARIHCGTRERSHFAPRRFVTPATGEVDRSPAPKSV